MRFNKILTAAAVASLGLTFVFSQGKAAEASINSEAKTKTYSGTKSLETLLKAAGLTYNQFNSVANGNKYGSRFGYRNGVGKPEGVVVHETASPGATAWDEGRYFNNNWMTAYTYVHAVVDNNQTIQLMSPDYGVWALAQLPTSATFKLSFAKFRPGPSSCKAWLTMPTISPAFCTDTI